MSSALLQAGLGLAGAYLLVVALLFVFQRSLLYPADARRVTPASVGLANFTEETLRTPDGETLVAWTAAPAEGRPLVLYLHGNGGSLATPGRVARFRALTARGYGLMALSWRGYGGSTGSPSETGLHTDAAAAFALAAARVGQGRVVVYGESLGTGPAVRLGAEHRPRAVVLEAPYLSTLAVAQGVYPFIPVAALMRDTFRSDLLIARLAAPLLVLHGESDGVIPVQQGRALFERAPPPKRLQLFPAGRHEDLWTHGALERVTTFLDDVEAGRLEGIERRREPGGRWPEPDLGN